MDTIDSNDYVWYSNIVLKMYLLISRVLRNYIYVKCIYFLKTREIFICNEV